MTSRYTLSLPADTTLATRLAWAGERVWDVVEGLLSRDDQDYAQMAVSGWLDLCSDDAREQYRAIYTQLTNAINTSREA
jgi:formaldehyde-activating enzyme involved in methanogenesis